MSQLAKIFIVEDDYSIRLLLSMALKNAGYAVTEFENADLALLHLNTDIPDAMLLDIMMDGTDGVTALQKIRANDNTKQLPVMMLTARDGETDKVIGLDAGADDYMTKPFGVLELCARVRALLRRNQPKSGSELQVLKSQDLNIDLSTFEVTLAGNPIDLTNKEFTLLKVLMQASPAALSREELLQKVWGYDFIGETRTLDMHIGTLRSKLLEDVQNPRFIKTVRGVGYRFKQETTNQ